jgi:hypothetical protein
MTTKNTNFGSTFRVQMYTNFVKKHILTYPRLIVPNGDVALAMTRQNPVNIKEHT